ncbi:uncharacterized protein L969DRAFT_52955 [Mixia osmundae IAM 14324]|uniref:Uncharacterized protein n=1 Tax=Mixia osmundae (strain CBS 9802 / IAM 14324 / JCM 22182 / KY 12970) TaxID=764103 RepID=G7DUW2_MIXOS|nr:uncharacterized protein L969DRAFT_52955 [Mixia osmundae IAM 14324]KEI37411.1 hypothetical protein L969DRAFT_52955 [Mixia osmundae IAM 14324]GAA94372.1 hypothetical protein E5Q_01023 [Mixia osmundae IAM 14324]
MVRHVAVIQGSSRGLGLAFSRHLLNNTRLHVVGTSRDPEKARHAILKDGDKSLEKRLTTLELDVLNEGTISAAAESVKSSQGAECLRLLINVSGILDKPEKSIMKLDADTLRRTFEINTFGHLLTFKHFLPLLPTKKEAKQDGSEDLAEGLLKPDLSVMASMSARVGSIADNKMGGWYSYRMSKAAVNQAVQTLNRELSSRSVGSSIALALHPGTVLGTDLSSPIVDPNTKEKDGVHPPAKAAQLLLQAIGKMGIDDGGKFIDFAGKEIPW